jgi:hypothetical protein
MYRGFSLKISEENIDRLINYQHNYSHSQTIRNALSRNIVASYSTDANELKSNWFPTIKSDVFLSHSHKDIELAKKIAYLLSKLRLGTFIDSEVWGYSDNLVKQIEEQYYPYGTFHAHDKIIAHVNIMLTSALTKMLDNTECIIFLNTPNSIIPAGYLNANKTDSPWIYHELFTTSILPVNTPIRKSHDWRPGSVINEANQPNILHTPPLDHLTDLDYSDFTNWINNSKNKNYYHSLDVLYELKPLKLDDVHTNVKIKFSGPIVHYQ